jgi:hypothetical protein
MLPSAPFWLNVMINVHAAYLAELDERLKEGENEISEALRKRTDYWIFSQP